MTQYYGEVYIDYEIEAAEVTGTLRPYAAKVGEGELPFHVETEGPIYHERAGVEVGNPVELFADPVTITVTPAATMGVAHMLELFASPVTISLSEAATLSTRPPSPRVGVEVVYAAVEDPSGWPYFSIPLQNKDYPEAGSPTRVGDLLLAVIVSRLELSEGPNDFSLEGDHIFTDAGDEQLYVSIWSRRIQSVDEVAWPDSQSIAVASSTYFASVVLKLSGAATGVVSSFADAELVPTVNAPELEVEGDLGFVVLASMSETTSAVPSDQFYEPLATMFDPGAGSVFISLLRSSTYDGFVGGLSSIHAWDFTAGADIERAIAGSFVVTASPSLTDEGAGVPTGVRSPIR